MLKEENRRNIINLAGGSFSGMSRIAKSSPQMWVDIFKQNRTNLLGAIDAFKNELDLCVQMIRDERWDELEAWMYEARKLRDII